MSDDLNNEPIEDAEVVEEEHTILVPGDEGFNPPPPMDPPAPRVGREAIMEATAEAVKYFEQQFKAIYPHQEFNAAQAALGIEQAIICAWPALYNEATRINAMIEEELQELEDLPSVPESHTEQTED